VALHGFWIMLSIPIIALTWATVSPRNLRCLGEALIAVGVLSVVGIALWQWFTWGTEAPPDRISLLLPRTLFLVFTKADYPILPATLAGTALWLIGWRTRAAAKKCPTAPSAG
jgi:hypothetical protein